MEKEDKRKNDPAEDKKNNVPSWAVLELKSR